MKDKVKTYPVDGEKLYAHLKIRMLSPANASREIGYSENYISNSVHKKRISNRGAILLEKLFDICPADYAPDCIEEMIEKAKPSDQPIDYERLEKIIYSATFAAMHDALAGEK